MTDIMQASYQDGFAVGEIVRVKTTGDRVCVLAVFRPVDATELGYYDLAYDVRTPDYRRVQLHAFELEAL
jgi:hypothetical protein